MRTFVHPLLAILTLTSLNAALAGGLRHRYGEALRATRQKGRPLLVVLDSLRHPEPRLRSGRHVKDTAQADLFRGYEVCHIDVDTEYGQKVADAFGARQFPHTAIIDRTGSVILYRNSGRMDTGQWVTTLAAHRSGTRAEVPRSRPRMSSGRVCFT